MDREQRMWRGETGGLTWGFPALPVTSTPPLSSATTLLHVRTSTSVSPGLYPAPGTFQFGTEPLPPFESSASSGGFDTAIVCCETA